MQPSVSDGKRVLFLFCLDRSSDLDSVSTGNQSLAGRFAWGRGLYAAELGLVEASRALGHALALNALSRGDVVEHGAILEACLARAPSAGLERVGDVDAGRGLLWVSLRTSEAGQSSYSPLGQSFLVSWDRTRSESGSTFDLSLLDHLCRRDRGARGLGGVGSGTSLTNGACGGSGRAFQVSSLRYVLIKSTLLTLVARWRWQDKIHSTGWCKPSRQRAGCTSSDRPRDRTR